MNSLEAYNQAKEICESYHNYKGDKRRSCYKRLQANCVDLWIHRMDNFAKELGLPNYVEYFYEGKRVEAKQEEATTQEEAKEEANITASDLEAVSSEITVSFGSFEFDESKESYKRDIIVYLPDGGKLFFEEVKGKSKLNLYSYMNELYKFFAYNESECLEAILKLEVIIESAAKAETRNEAKEELQELFKTHCVDGLKVVGVEQPERVEQSEQPEQPEQEITTGSEVVRISGDYVVGRTGIVIEIDKTNNRAHVDWFGESKTWVKLTCLALKSKPYKIDYSGKYPKYIALF